ncbi:Cna B-type domain-containing protein [Erysipelothrix aquatica]|uniref:Cna B-type domain-containing protein n=1 Tax=Erysipelothrix aquatica TaxID=2683714 RepID=UPI00135BA053|nr:Cna B-type domain-containing protein [Erysipelothrix aquatica]
MSINGSKTWVDGESPLRPETITVRLYADGTEVTNVIPIWVKAGDVWIYTFKDGPKMNLNQTIIYTVSEDAVTGYQTNITDFNITNTLVEPPLELISIQ